MKHLMDLGVLHHQPWSPMHRQLAMEWDTHDISDPRHILNPGLSDTQAEASR